MVERGERQSGRAPKPSPDDVPESARNTDWRALLAWVGDAVELIGPPERVREREWSASARLPTADGAVWVKAAARGFVAEPATTVILSAVAPQHVLTPIAADRDRGWLVLPDGGPTLRERDEDGPTTERLLRTVHDAVAAQAADVVDELLAAGVPDRRPTYLPALLDELLALLGREDPLARSGLDEHVAGMRSAVYRWSAELDAIPGRPTVDHLDSHSGNAVGGTRQAQARTPLRLLDWGDAVVTHPGLSRLGAGAAGEPPNIIPVRELVRAGSWARTTARGRREHPLLAAHLGRIAQRAATIQWNRSRYADGSARKGCLARLRRR